MADGVFDCEIQARFRDINLAGHVDNVEAMRIVDEARLVFLRFADLPGVTRPGSEHPGLLGGVPSHVAELVGGQRVEYHSEMRFVPFQPFGLRLWVSHVGWSSFTTSIEMRTGPDRPPALIAEATMVLWDHRADAAWRIDDDLRTHLARYQGAPLDFR